MSHQLTHPRMHRNFPKLLDYLYDSVTHIIEVPNIFTKKRNFDPTSPCLYNYYSSTRGFFLTLFSSRNISQSPNSMIYTQNTWYKVVYYYIFKLFFPSPNNINLHRSYWWRCYVSPPAILSVVCRLRRHTSCIRNMYGLPTESFNF